MSTYNGDFLWGIPDVSRRICDAEQARSPQFTALPSIFSSHTGYRMCLRAYLNGDGMGEKTHLALLFVVMKEEFDVLLPWPFQSRITLTQSRQTNKQTNKDKQTNLINQDNCGGDVHGVFTANPHSKSFQRPTSENVASGCPKFVPLKYLNNPSYVTRRSVHSLLGGHNIPHKSLRCVRNDTSFDLRHGVGV